MIKKVSVYILIIGTMLVGLTILGAFNVTILSYDSRLDLYTIDLHRYFGNIQYSYQDFINNIMDTFAFVGSSDVLDWLKAIVNLLTLPIRVAAGAFVLLLSLVGIGGGYQNLQGWLGTIINFLSNGIFLD